MSSIKKRSKSDEYSELCLVKQMLTQLRTGFWVKGTAWPCTEGSSILTFHKTEIKFTILNLHIYLYFTCWTGYVPGYHGDLSAHERERS